MNIDARIIKPSDKPDWKGELSDTMIPRFVFLQKTLNSVDTAGLHKTIAKKFENMPPEIVEQMASKITARLAKQMGGGTRTEYHTFMLVQDTKNDKLLVLAGAAYIGEDGVFTDEKISVLDDEESSSEMDRMVASIYTTAMHSAYSTTWHGERVMRLFMEDIESVADLHARLEKEGVGVLDIFKKMVPHAIGAGDMPVLELDPVEKSKKRAALIAKFGEKAIVELEAKIAEAKTKKV